MDSSAAIHATLLGYNGIGCLLLGPSGCGKSRLAAETLVLGGRVIADDKVYLSMRSGMLMGQAAPNFSGIVELRGVGLYKQADAPTQQVIHLAIELGQAGERFPPKQTRSFEGVQIPFLRMPSPPNMSGLYLLAVMKAVHEGRILPQDWHPTA